MPHQVNKDLRECKDPRVLKVPLVPPETLVFKEITAHLDPRENVETLVWLE